MKRPRRKQPRRLTPPLILRDDDGGRECIEVDEEHTTTHTLKSGRVSAYLILSSDLRITLGSRCVNKRRVPVINITAIPVLTERERIERADDYADVVNKDLLPPDLSLQEAVDFMAGAGMNVITFGFDEPTTKEGGE